MKKTLIIATAAVIICLTIAKFVGPSFRFQATSAAKTEQEEARVRETIERMLEDYQGKNKQLFQEFEKKLQKAGNAGYDKARSNVRPFVNKVTNLSFCSKLSAAMAYDQLKDTSKAMDMLAPELSSMVIQPCEEGQAEIVEALNEFLLKVQENDTQFKAGLARLLEQDNFAVSELGLRDDFLANNLKLAQKVQNSALDKTLVAVGTAIEIAFLHSTYKYVSVALANIVKHLTATATVGPTIAAADGPFPVGDVICVTICVVGTGWTCYDLYRVTRKLPADMRKYMTDMIDNYQRDSKNKALERAKTVLQLCDASCLEISKTIEK